jgi:hypothetical protein
MGFVRLLPKFPEKSSRINPWWESISEVFSMKSHRLEPRGMRHQECGSSVGRTSTIIQLGLNMSPSKKIGGEYGEVRAAIDVNRLNTYLMFANSPSVKTPVSVKQFKVGLLCAWDHKQLWPDP